MAPPTGPAAGLLLLLLAAGLAGPASAAAGNPFAGKSPSDFYINPVNFRQYQSSLASASGQVKANLAEMQAVPSAYWIDVKEKIKAKAEGEDLRSLEGILRDAAAKPQKQLCVFMWYDLPNRDCKAHASNGEICCNKNSDGTCNYKLGGDCAEGLREYKREYVDPFVEVLRDFEERVPIVVVVEPDSLPNLATNMAHPHCGSSATQRAYREGVSYSLHQLHLRAPKVTVYLDAAHGGWLGWENSMEKFMRVLEAMDLPPIRGFATNVANYQPLGIQCPWCPDQGFRNGYCLNGKHQDDPCCTDPCSLASQYNFGNNELNYAAGLVAAADHMLGWDAHVIIDTGRNGVTDHRSTCSNWCNPRGSGAGVKSTADVANSSLVDAYFWLKTPGESDGCTQELPGGGKCPRYDHMCGSEDSLGSRAGEPRSPEAGHWFDFQVKELAEQANFEPPPKPAAGTAAGSCSAAGGHGGHQQHHGDGQHGAQSSGESGQGDADLGGVCSPAYGQCGGRHWHGPKCCQQGCFCRHEGEWYSQCEPPAGNHMCSSGLLVELAEEQGAEASLGELQAAGSAKAVALALGVTASMALALAASLAAARSRSASGPGASGRSPPPGPAEELAFLEAAEHSA